MLVCVAFAIEHKQSYLKIIAEKVWIFGFIIMMAFILLSMLYDGVIYCKNKSFKKKVEDRLKSKLTKIM